MAPKDPVVKRSERLAKKRPASPLEKEHDKQQRTSEPPAHVCEAKDCLTEIKKVQAAIQKLSESVTDCSERMRAMAVFSADSKSAIAAQLMTHRADMVRMVGQNQEKQRKAIEEITTYVHRHFEDIRRRFERLDEIVGVGTVHQRAARLQAERDRILQEHPALPPNQLMALEGDDDDDDGEIEVTWETALQQARQALLADGHILDPEAQQL